MRKNCQSGLLRTPRLAIGISIVLLPTLVARAGTRPPGSSYGCSDIHKFLERSEGAFPPFLDPQVLLEYPVRDALKELQGACLERELSQADVRETIERHVGRSLAPGRSRFTLAIVSFSWCSACAKVFPSYRQLAKRHRGDIRFVFLDGDAYDGRFDPAPESPFSDLISRACRVRVVPFYPGYCVLDDRGEVLQVGATPQPTQSFYGGRGLSLAMKLIFRAQEAGKVKGEKVPSGTAD